MIVLACVCLPVVPFLPVDDRVTEEERAEEPEDPCHEQEAAASSSSCSPAMATWQRRNELLFCLLCLFS